MTTRELLQYIGTDLFRNKATNLFYDNCVDCDEAITSRNMLLWGYTRCTDCHREVIQAIGTINNRKGGKISKKDICFIETKRGYDKR